MTDRYENIRRALAMGPTPGPWKAHDPSESGWMDITNAPYATPLCYAAPVSDYQYDAELGRERFVKRAHETPANAAHIAACDPDTLRELLAERDQLAAALEAAREDARKWRYWANGPQGTFLTDDLELATAILAAYDKDDDWTVTDIVDPTGAAIDQARGKGGGEVEGG